MKSLLFTLLFTTISTQALERSVKDRVKLDEAVDRGIMTSEQYHLALCAHYTHAEALFTYDQSVKPKLVGVSRRISKTDPYKWEEASVSSLHCDQVQKHK